eukprot:scaffold253627_cov19-Tisochrysis_lutea.AAC.1
MDCAAMRAGFTLSASATEQRRTKVQCRQSMDCTKDAQNSAQTINGLQGKKQEQAGNLRIGVSRRMCEDRRHIKSLTVARAWTGDVLGKETRQKHSCYALPSQGMCITRRHASFSTEPGQGTCILRAWTGHMQYKEP